MRLRTFLLAALVLALIPAAASADVPHVVQTGETLTSVASVDGLSVGALAVANNISTTSQLVAGQILEIPPRTRANRASGAKRGTVATATVQPSVTTSVGDGTGGTALSTSTAAGTASSSVGTTPYATQEHVTGSQIAAIATANGVPAALAEAIAWQESGWNNAEVSNVGAVGVMQIVPSTWTWIDSYLTPSAPLGTSSALENVRAGVLLLHQLLALTENNQSLAIAGYFQGLSSVAKIGLYRSTRRYVANVEALEQRLAA